MFLLSKEIRNKSFDELKSILQEKLSEQSESLDSLNNIRLTKTNKPDVYYFLARFTSWLEGEESSKYFVRRAQDPFEVEHIWANKYERHTTEFQNEYEFDEHRNKLGDLLLLPKSFNASYGALPFDDKVDLYFGQNLLAQTLSSKAYANNPNFLTKMKSHALPFRAYDSGEFNKQAIVDRQALYLALAKCIWPDSLLDNF